MTRQDLIEGFRYDLWANLRWIATIGSGAEWNPARSVMQHVVQSQWVWLEQFSPSGFPEPTEDYEQWLEPLHQKWVALVEGSEPATTFSYVRTSTQETITRTYEEAARHIVNHGSYHRGQLREIAERIGAEQIPETDWIYWTDELKGVGPVK